VKIISFKWIYPVGFPHATFSIFPSQKYSVSNPCNIPVFYAGVHGGLLVHEPRFTAELLASLLSIPPSKTLLRRHLNTHFKELLGRECIQEKREAEATLGYVPLSATTKVKVSAVQQIYITDTECAI
jgi:hypothetical protein